MKENAVIPEDTRFGSWSIDREEWDQLDNLIREEGFRTFVEFGMGTSTKLITQYAEKYLGYEIFDETIEMFPDQRIIRRDFRLPVDTEDVKNDIRDMGPIDLCFVDGPQGCFQYNGCSRYFSILAASRISDCIILHDAKRKGEKKTIKKLLKGWKKIKLKSDRGMILFIKTEK